MDEQELLVKMSKMNQEHGIASMLLSIPVPSDFPKSFGPWWNQVCELFASSLIVHALIERGTTTTSSPLIGQGSIPVWSSYTSGGENFEKYKPLIIPTADGELLYWDETTTQQWAIGTYINILPAIENDEIYFGNSESPSTVLETTALNDGILEWMANDTFVGHDAGTNLNILYSNNGTWVVGQMSDAMIPTESITVVQDIQLNGTVLEMKTVQLDVVNAASPSGWGTVSNWSLTSITFIDDVGTTSTTLTKSTRAIYGFAPGASSGLGSYHTGTVC